MHLNSDNAQKEVPTPGVPAPAEVQGSGRGSAEGQTHAEIEEEIERLRKLGFKVVRLEDVFLDRSRQSPEEIALAEAALRRNARILSELLPPAQSSALLAATTHNAEST